jgi:hypothetical protein
MPSSHRAPATERASPDEQDHAHVRDRIERDPAEIGDRGVCLRLDLEVVELGEARAGEGDRDDAPGEPISPDQHRACPGKRYRGDDQALIEPGGEERVELTLRRGEQNDRGVHGKGDEGGGQRRRGPGPLLKHSLSGRFVTSDA